MIQLLREPLTLIPIVVTIIYKTMCEEKQQLILEEGAKKTPMPDSNTEEYEVKVRWKKYILDLFKKKSKVLSSYVPPLVTENDLSDLNETDDLTPINPPCPDCGLEWEKLDRPIFEVQPGHGRNFVGGRGLY